MTVYILCNTIYLYRVPFLGITYVLHLQTTLKYKDNVYDYCVRVEIFVLYFTWGMLTALFKKYKVTPAGVADTCTLRVGDVLPHPFVSSVMYCYPTIVYTKQSPP